MGVSRLGFGEEIRKIKCGHPLLYGAMYTYIVGFVKIHEQWGTLSTMVCCGV